MTSNSQLDRIVPLCPHCSFPIGVGADYGGVHIDLQSMRGWVDEGEKVNLHARQAQVLHILIEGRGKIIPFATFEDRMWPDEQELTFSVRINVGVHVCHLRKLLDITIRNVPGIGYSLMGRLMTDEVIVKPKETKP